MLEEFCIKFYKKFTKRCGCQNHQLLNRLIKRCPTTYFSMPAASVHLVDVPCGTPESKLRDSLHRLINTLPSTMPSNRTSNDIDFVQPTQYNVQPNQIAKKPPPEPWELVERSSQEELC